MYGSSFGLFRTRAGEKRIYNGNDMKFEKQVNIDHYQFGSYMLKGRWISVWHQLDEMQKLKPRNVLEVGPGPGLFKAVAAIFGFQVETLDMDPELKPDYVASVTAMPFPDSAYDVVCAFQMLEHLPYEVALQAFREMVRVSGRNVVISLPDAQPVWSYHFHIPRINTYQFLIPHPFRKASKLESDPEHYWEINRPAYLLSRIIEDFSRYISLVNTYRVHENPYHRFFIFAR